MLPDRVSNPGPLTYESGALPIALRGPAFFIAGRPKAALLSWFFGDYRCGVWLFMVILVKYKYK